VQTRAGALAAGASVLVAVLLVSAAVPPQAHAVSIPNPLNVITGGIGSLLGGAAAPIVGLAVKAFDAIIKALFAPIAKLVTVALVGWLSAIPNFAQGNVAQLEQTVAAICGGVLGAVATLSVIRYWLAGFAGGGDSGFSALEGLVRTVAAALFIAMWPWLFERAIGLTNLLTGAVLGAGITNQEVAKLLEAGLAGTVIGSVSGIGLFLGIVVAAAASLLFLGLLLMKIVLSLTTILLFVGMPFAAVLWPVAPWIGRLVSRAFAVCLAIPVLWALCFAAAGALTVDTLTFKELTGGANGVLNTLLSPLVAIVLLYMMVRLPLHLSRVAMLGGMALGGGFVGRAASNAASSHIRDTAKQHLPEGLGGRPAQQPQAESSLGRKLRTAANAAGVAATGGMGVGAAAASGGAASAGMGARSAAVGSSAFSAGGATTGAAAKAAGGARDPLSYKPTPLAESSASGQATGFRDGPFHQERFNDEMQQAEHTQRNNPVSVGEARAALADLPRDTQQAIAQLAGENSGEDTRSVLADQATKYGWTDEQQDALRTLTAATPKVRDEALQEAKEDDWITRGPDGSLWPATEDSITGGGARSADTIAAGSDPSLSAPQTLDVAGTDPGSPDRPGGQPRRTPPKETGGTTPPPATGGTNVRLPREPRDPNQYGN